MCFQFQLQTRGLKSATWQQEEVYLQYQSITISSGHVTSAYASAAQTDSDMKRNPGKLLHSLGYESQSKSVLDK